jgi:hypothetical protein
MGSNESLENLLRSGVLKAEPPDRKECEGLMRSALDRHQGCAHLHALVFQPVRFGLQRRSRAGADSSSLEWLSIGQALSGIPVSDPYHAKQ